MVKEVESRNKLFAEAGVDSIDEYNKIAKKKMNKIWIVIEEISIFMSDFTDSKEEAKDVCFNLVFRYLEEYKFITLDEAAILFFKGHKGNCSRRFKKLMENKKVYASYSYMDFLAHQRKVFTLEKTKQISTHKIIIMDFYSWIIKNGGEIVKYELERPIRYGQLIPDAVAVFRLKGNIYHVFLEVDHTHYTSFAKLNRYENAAYTKFLKEAIGVDKFIVIIAREDIEEIKNRYSGPSYY